VGDKQPPVSVSAIPQGLGQELQLGQDGMGAAAPLPSGPRASACPAVGSPSTDGVPAMC
jgi:hypothetical protein